MGKYFVYFCLNKPLMDRPSHVAMVIGNVMNFCWNWIGSFCSKNREVELYKP